MDDFQKVKINSLYYRLVKNFFQALGTSLVLAVVFGILPAIGAQSITLFFGILGTILLIVYVLGILKALLEYVNLKYKVEEQSLSFRSGLLSVSTTNIPYSKITNVSFDQSFLERIFSVGDVNIDEEDSGVGLAGVDSKIGDIILDAIAKKSNIQPISQKV